MNTIPNKDKYEQENIKTVQEIFAAFEKNDIKPILDFLAGDIEWRISGSDGIPYAGTRQGRDQVADFFKIFSESVELTRFEPQRFFSQGNHVVVTGYEEGHAKPSGCDFANHWTMVFTFTQGKVAKFHEYIDSTVPISTPRRS